MATAGGAGPFSDLTLEMMARTADDLTNAPTRGAFDKVAFSTLSDLRERLGASQLFLVVTFWKGGEHRTILRGHHETERTAALLDQVGRSEVFTAFTESRTIVRVATDRGGPLAMAGLMDQSGIRELWLIPSARSLPATNYAVIGFTDPAPRMRTEEDTGLLIFCTLLMSRVISRGGMTAWKQAFESLGPNDDECSNVFELDTDGKLVRWPHSTEPDQRWLHLQVDGAQSLVVRDAVRELVAGHLTAYEIETRLRPGDNPRAGERVRIIARARVGGGAEGVLLPPSDAALLPASMAELLSMREREIAQLIVSGLRVRKVAEMLFLSEHTVRNHLKSVFAKIGVSSQVALIDRARSETDLERSVPR